MSQPRPTDPIGSIGWTERTGGVLTTRECLTLARPLLPASSGAWARADQRLAVHGIELRGRADDVKYTRGSALLGWVKDDAQYIADQIASLASTGTSPAAPAVAAEPPRG
jgi:hypothetical protein